MMQAVVPDAGPPRAAATGAARRHAASAATAETSRRGFSDALVAASADGGASPTAERRESTSSRETRDGRRTDGPEADDPSRSSAATPTAGEAVDRQRSAQWWWQVDDQSPQPEADVPDGEASGQEAEGAVEDVGGSPAVQLAAAGPVPAAQPTEDEPIGEGADGDGDAAATPAESSQTARGIGTNAVATAQMTQPPEVKSASEPSAETAPDSPNDAETPVDSASTDLLRTAMSQADADGEATSGDEESARAAEMSHQTDRAPQDPANADSVRADLTGDSVDDATATVAIPAWRRADLEAALQAVQPAPPPVPAEAAAVVHQMVKGLRIHWKTNLGEARIQLRPEHLGQVDVSIKVEGGAVTAVVRAESAQVEEWLIEHQQSLRQQLEAAGLRLDDLVISRDGERRQAPQGRDEAPRRSRSQPRAAGDPEPIFSIVV